MSRSTPPLLMMMAEGRKPRVRKFRAPAPREITLHLSVVDLLRKLADPAWRWTHFPAGEARDVRTGAKLKRMGTKPGWPDLILISPAGGFYGLELKRVGEGLTEDQASFQKWAVSRGVPYAVALSLDEAITILTHWKCLRPLAPGGA